MSKDTEKKNPMINMCLGMVDGDGKHFIGTKVTMGIGGTEFGEIIRVDVAGGTLHVTATIKEEHADLMRAFFVERSDLIAPRIEVNLRAIPAHPLMGCTELEEK